MSTPKKTIYVNYCDTINEAKVKVVMAVLSDVMNRERPDTIYCLFSSTGGVVDSGITLHNFLRALPIELIMHNTGSIDSIANIVFLAGSVRYASIHSSFLFHGVNWNIPAASALARSQVAEILSSIDASEAKIAGIITERTKLTAEEIRTLFGQGESKDATFALSKGIVSEIINPTLPKDVPIYSFNLP